MLINLSFCSKTVGCASPVLYIYFVKNFDTADYKRTMTAVYSFTLSRVLIISSSFSLHFVCTLET